MTDTIERLQFLQGIEHPVGESSPEDDFWFTNDSRLTHYFQGVELPGHPEGAQSLIHAQIGYDNAAIDIAGGSNGRALKEMRATEAIVKGLVTNYKDNRGEYMPGELPFGGVSRSDADIDFIHGDLIRPSTWQAIIAWQRENASGGVGLVMHRPDKALQNLPPSFYQGAVNVLLDMIRPGGVLFTQVPTSLRSDWVRMMSPQNSDPAEARETICRSVVGRADVTEVLVSEKPDRKEHCAVIIK